MKAPRGSERVTDVLGSFFLRLSQARSLLDVNTAAGVAEQELEEEIEEPKKVK